MTNLQKRITSSIILIPIVLFFIVKGSFFFNFFICACFLVTVYEWRLISNKSKYFFPGLLFLFFSFYSVFLIRDNNSLVIFIFIILTCIATDIGGYLFGKIFKGPKLTKISPNKTYAGVFGSFLMSFIVTLIFFSDLNLILNTIYLALIISFFSQIGDLIISFLKRKAKIKDTGGLLPGHGGLLDRLDGILLAIPIGIILVGL